MKKTYINIILILSFTPFLMQCVAAEKEVRGLDLQIRTLNTNQVNLERDIARRTQAVNDSLINIQHDIKRLQVTSAHQAGISGEVDQLNTRLLQLKGQIDENMHLTRRLQQENIDLKRELSIKLEGSDSRFKDLSITVTRLNEKLEQSNLELQNAVASIKKIKQFRAKEAADQAIAARKAAEAAREKAAQEAAARKAAAQEAARMAQRTELGGTILNIVPKYTKQKINQPPATITPAPATPPATTTPAQINQQKVIDREKELFKQGVSLFKAKKFSESHRTFTEYINQHPRSIRMADARFWRGETMYYQQQFELAILEYQNVIADFSTHPKAPAAMLKQGRAFEKLNEPATARIVYNKLLEEYPNSPQALAAKKQLEAL